jgi:hypothetical protein
LSANENRRVPTWTFERSVVSGEPGVAGSRAPLLGAATEGGPPSVVAVVRAAGPCVDGTAGPAAETEATEPEPGGIGCVEGWGASLDIVKPLGIHWTRKE